MPGRQDQRPGRKVLESHRVILKRRVKVGLGKMPGVAGLGKEAEIRELKLADQVSALRQVPLAIIPMKARVDKEKTRHDQAAHKEKYQESG